jgi:hypothetical protein
MARTAYGDQSSVDPELPVEEVASPPVSPAPPQPNLSEEAPPTTPAVTRPVGSSVSDLGLTPGSTARPPADATSTPAADQTAPNFANHANDLTAVQNTLLATVNAGQFSGAELAHVQAILSDLTNAISTANASASGAGMFGGGGQALLASQLSMLNAVDTDPVLATPAPVDPIPAAPPAPTPPTLAEIGEMFDDVAGQILGGVNDDNRAQITDDVNTLISDMQALMEASPELFEGETGARADAIVQQLQLELTYLSDPAISPNAAEASVDNILDIIDLVQSDPKLAALATQDGADGFSPIPGAEDPAPIEVNNEAQTAFAANFIAQSNALGQQAVALAGSNDAEAITTLIADLQAFEQSVSESAPGEAGALSAEIAALVKGLQTGNTDLVAAAAEQLHGNAVDVASTNVPASGGTYNPEGTTVAEVLGTPGTAPPPLPAGDAPAVAAAGDDAAPVEVAEVTALADIEPDQSLEMAQLHHMWG